MQFRGDDLRVATREGHESNLVLFCVDASGSMAARKRMEQVKTAILSLLLDAYQRRDKVGLVTFRGDRAELVLPPTHSVDIAAAPARRPPGRWPYAAGRGPARGRPRARGRAGPRPAPPAAARRGHRRPRHRRPRRRRAARRLAAGHLAGRGIAALVVDCETGPMRLGLADAARRPPARRARAGRRGQRRRRCTRRRSHERRGMTRPTCTTSSRAAATSAPSSAASRSTPTCSHRILGAAHAAPSVGHSQPWDFVARARHRDPRAVPASTSRPSARRTPPRCRPTGRETFDRIKVEGIRESGARRRGHLRPRPRRHRRCSAGTRSPTPGSTRPASPSRTSGSPPPPRASASAGCRSTARSSSRDLLGIPERRPADRLALPRPGRPTSRRSPTSSATAGARSRPLADADPPREVGELTCRKGQPTRRPRRRAHHPPAPQPPAADGPHRRRQGEVDRRLRPGHARLEPGLERRRLPVREVRQVAHRRADRARAPRRAARGDRRGRAGRVAQDGRRLVVVAQGRRRRGPRRRGRRGLGRDQAPAGRGDPRPLRARRVHLPDEVGLGRRRRRRRDAGEPARAASTS